MLRPRNSAGDRLRYRNPSGSTCYVLLINEGRIEKAVCKGAQVVYALGAAQGDVQAVLTTGHPDAGRKYCASFGPATSANVVKDGSNGKVYLAKDAGAPAACP